jgi:hypothetical protein
MKKLTEGPILEKVKPWGPQSICLPVLDKNSKERFSKERPTPLLLFAKRNTRSLWRLTINCFSAIGIPRRSTKERIVLQRFVCYENESEFGFQQQNNMDGIQSPM